MNGVERESTRKSKLVQTLQTRWSTIKQNMDAVEIDTSRPPQTEDALASTVKICRVCLLDNLMMRDLFLETNAASLSRKLMSFINVKVSCAPLRLATDASLDCLCIIASRFLGISNESLIGKVHTLPFSLRDVYFSLPSTTFVVIM